MRAAALPALGPLSVAVVAGLLLAPFATIDPVPGVSWSPAAFSDEAWNLMGARNFVLFGHPSTDEWRTWLLTLPFTAVHAAAMAVFGVELIVPRLVTIATVGLTGAAIAAALARPVGPVRAWVAGIAYVTSTLVLYYGRLGFLEPMVAAFLAVGVLTLAPAQRARAFRWGLVGGAALGLAVMTKAVAIVAAALVVIVVAIGALRLPFARRWTAGAALSAGALAAAWTLLVLWPRWRSVRLVLEEIYPQFVYPASLDQLWTHLARFPLRDNVAILAAPLLLLAVIGIVRVVRAERRRPVEGGGAGEPSAGAWLLPTAAFVALLGSVLLIASADYQPNRYVVAFLSLAAIVGAWGLPARLSMRDRPSRALAAWVVIAVAAQGVAHQIVWIRNGGAQLAHIQAAAAAIPDGATLAGGFAPLVAFRERVVTVVPFNAVNDGDLYARGVRYLVWPPDDPPAWAERHPEAWAARRTLGCINWPPDRRRVCLYRLP